jgi:hypothetical protein
MQIPLTKDEEAFLTDEGKAPIKWKTTNPYSLI